jgi:signal transduction histidine kinase
MTPRSLKHVLTVGVLIANFACSATFSAVAIGHELHGRRRAFDVMLQGRADSLVASLGHVPQSQVAAPNSDLFEIVNAAGFVVVHSRNMKPDAPKLVGRPSDYGYFDFTWEGKPYRALRLQEIVAGTEHEPSFTVIYAASTDDLRHEAVEAAIYYTKVALSFLLGITVLLIWFLRSRLAPLNELAMQAGRVSTDSWQFETPASALGVQELRPIAISIQSLLHGLKMSFDRQKQFTGDAAHELKTSIAILKTRLQLLSMRQRNVEEYEQGMSELLSDLLRMEELTTGMLTLTRIEGDGAEPMQSFDLCKVVRSIVENLRPMATVKGVTVCVRTEDSSHIQMHLMDAEILCSNLLTNALQHSPERSMMMVSVLANGETVEFRVADCGEGIPAESIEHIFERFFRVDSSRSRRTGGFGLGLAICKGIADRSMATIVVTSEVGRGTEVLVTFPAQVCLLSSLSLS